MSYKIAIDGPSSAGKSTVAKKIASELGYYYIDTGAIYRALALYLIENDIDFNDEKAIKDVLDKIDVKLQYVDGALIVLLNGVDVTADIRTEKVSNAASVSSQFKSVRDKLFSIQRYMAENYNSVMDGRDIASRIMPDADLKIFLTASVDCRAKRRYDEYIEKGIDTSFEQVKEEIEERDYRDQHRFNDPLLLVDDAILIDTTDMSIDQVVDSILKRVL